MSSFFCTVKDVYAGHSTDTYGSDASVFVKVHTTDPDFHENIVVLSQRLCKAGTCDSLM